MQTVKVESIYINSTKQDGSPFVNKKGETYSMATLTYDGGQKASMYMGIRDIKNADALASWEVGDSVNVIIEKNGDYTNFKLPGKTDMMETRIDELETELKKLKKLVLLMRQGSKKNEVEIDLDEIAGQI